MTMRRWLAGTAAVTAVLAVVVACKRPQVPATSTHPAAPVAAVQTAPAPAPRVDVDFVTGVASTDLFEVQAAKIAEARSANPQVKAFAREMIKAHTATTQALTGVLKAENSTIATPTALDGAHTAALAALNTMAGRSFDRMYVGLQVRAHLDAINVFQGYLKAGGDPQIKAFARKTLPAVQHHLDMANRIQATIM